MLKKWWQGLLVGLLLGSLFVASPAAQNYTWTVVNGLPFTPALGLIPGTPSVTTNLLYNVGGSLYFNGSSVGAGFPLTAPNGGAIRTGTTAADTLLLQAYDTDAPGYTTLLTLTAGTTPGMVGLFAAGSATNPSVAIGRTDVGFYYGSGYGILAATESGSDPMLSINNNIVSLLNGSYLAFASAAIAELILSRESAGILQLGLDVNGSATAQTVKAHDGITGTDIAGANLTLAGGRGTGAGAPGTLIFQTATALGSGTTAQTLATRLIIGATGAATFGTTAGTGAGDVYAGAYFTGTTAGIDKTCTAAPTALTFNKGILTAATCTDPDPEAAPLTADELRALRAMLLMQR